MKHFIFGLLSTAALCTFSLGAIDAGKPMPAIDAVKWYTKPVTFPHRGLRRLSCWILHPKMQSIPSGCWKP